MKKKIYFLVFVLICTIIIAVGYHLRTIDKFYEEQKVEDSKDLYNIVLLLEIELRNACDIYQTGDMTSQIEDYHFARLQIISKIFFKTTEQDFKESFRFFGMLTNSGYHFDDRLYNLYLEVLNEIIAVQEAVDLAYNEKDINENKYWNLFYEKYTSQEFNHIIRELIDEFTN